MDERLEQVPGIVRIAAGAAWRSTVWTAAVTRRTGRLVLRTVTDPEASAELVEEIARDVGEAARTVSTVARRIQERDHTPTPTDRTSRTCAPGVPGSWSVRVTCGPTSRPTRRSRGSSTTWLPTRPGS